MYSVSSLVLCLKTRCFLKRFAIKESNLCRSHLKDMADKEDANAAFLTEVTELLHECEVPLEPHPAAVTAFNDGLLLDSQRILAETQALLGTSAVPAVPAQASSTSVSSEDSASDVANRDVGSDMTPAEHRSFVKNALAAKRRLRYREKLKTERKSLQQQESKLSTMLRQLQQRRAQAKTHRNDSLTFSAWRAIATLQMDNRLQAEAQHQQLEAAVASRAVLIQQMNGLLQQRLVDGDASRFMSTGEVSSGVGSSDAMLFEAFLRDLDSVYAQTDAMVRKCGTHIEPSSSIRYKPTWKRHNGSEYLENVDVTLSPFDYLHACQVAWQAMTMAGDASVLRYGVSDPEATAAMKFRAKYGCEPFGVASMVIRWVLRKYVEADRVVFVWRALLEGEEEFAGMHWDETGWWVFRALQGNPSTATSVASRRGSTFDMVVRAVPTFCGSGSGSQGNVDQFTKLAVRACEEEFAGVTRAMQRLLINEGHAFSEGLV
ncbi:hypothetical protein BBJ28_00003393 [Nothophytophthora sp. Chile5]|nr:hypothetical protein BBJ28_00003393 [Nothophytophthora sp. Chile5]